MHQSTAKISNRMRRVFWIMKVSFSCLKTRDIDLQLSDPELFFAFKQTALNQSIPMLRSNHLQPGINLNPISFPSADLTLKVFEL